MMAYRYLSVERPVSIGTFPKTKTFLGFENFDERKEIRGVPAWGWVKYSEPIPDKLAKEYELVLITGR